MIERIILKPSGGGRFEVTLDDVVLFSKIALGRHAQPGEIVELTAARLGPPIVQELGH